MGLDYFIKSLTEAPKIERCFNPYAEYDPTYDIDDAPKIRARNLYAYLSLLRTTRPQIALIGEAPGYAGARFTGIPFTSESQASYLQQLPSLSKLDIKQTSKRLQPWKERTASHIWSVFSHSDQLPLLWNAFPLHPHTLAGPMTNRAPTRTELQFGLRFLANILQILQPQAILAIGRKAETSLRQLGITATYVCHPSYGKHHIFKAQLLSALDLGDQHNN